MQNNAMRRRIDWSPASGRETSEPGIERASEHEGHQAEVNEVDRHIDQRQRERNIAVPLGFRPLLGRLLLRQIVRAGYFGGGANTGHGNSQMCWDLAHLRLSTEMNRRKRR